MIKLFIAYFIGFISALVNLAVSGGFFAGAGIGLIGGVVLVLLHMFARE